LSSQQHLLAKRLNGLRNPTNGSLML